jgi:hypothetical protein
MPIHRHITGALVTTAPSAVAPSVSMLREHPAVVTGELSPLAADRRPEVNDTHQDVKQSPRFDGLQGTD